MSLIDVSECIWNFRYETCKNYFKGKGEDNFVRVAVSVTVYMYVGVHTTVSVSINQSSWLLLTCYTYQPTPLRYRAAISYFPRRAIIRAVQVWKTFQSAAWFHFIQQPCRGWNENVSRFNIIRFDSSTFILIILDRYYLFVNVWEEMGFFFSIVGQIRCESEDVNGILVLIFPAK